MFTSNGRVRMAVSGVSLLQAVGAFGGGIALWSYYCGSGVYIGKVKCLDSYSRDLQGTSHLSLSKHAFWFPLPYYLEIVIYCVTHERNLNLIRCRQCCHSFCVG